MNCQYQSKEKEMLIKNDVQKQISVIKKLLLRRYIYRSDLRSKYIYVKIYNTDDVFFGRGRAIAYQFFH
jgi:hypothetical protein